MIKLPVIIIVICLLVFSCQPISPRKDQLKDVTRGTQETPAPAKESPQPVFRFENDSLKSTTNIHYTGKYCNECHEKTPVEGGEPYLRFDGDYKELCRCHTDIPAKLLHPVSITLSPEKKKKIPADFPLKNGELTCDTCHDIYLQCQKSLFRKNSLRGAPYSSRTDFCFKCHEKKQYERLNPHDQINDAGEIMIDKCLYCHEEKPDEAHATFKEVKFIGDIETLCRRCHLIAGNHSGNVDHMAIVPAPDGLRRINAMEKKYNLILPLDENGKMTCITCHNPHENGVIPGDMPGAKGAGAKYRHRLPENLCKECHQM